MYEIFQKIILIYEIKGYITLSVLLHEEHEMIPLIINSFKLDLDSPNEHSVCLALSAVCNIGGKEMAESLAPTVEKVLIAKNTVPMVRKKASMCLLRLYQRNKDFVEPTVWVDRCKELLKDTDKGVVTSVMSFVNFMASTYPDIFQPLHKTIVTMLSNTVNAKNISDAYIYHRIPAPWLSIKLLKFLQIYPIPDDLTEAQTLVDLLSSIITGSTSPSLTVNDVNTKNAVHAILFEAIKTAINLRTASTLIESCCQILCKFMTEKFSNIRYLSLELLSRMAVSSSETLHFIKKHQHTITSSLKDNDISIRRRSLELVYSMCDKKNCKGIVSELLSYLHDLNVNILNDYEIREDIIMKIAILAQKYCTFSEWYIDVMVELISLAGESMSDLIWYGTVKVIMSNPEVTPYAMEKAFREFKKANSNESMIKLGSYLLGEYAHFLLRSGSSNLNEIFSLLSLKFKTSEDDTKALILSTYLKFCGRYPETTNHIIQLMKLHLHQMNSELQQRAVEYLELIQLNNPSLLRSVCEAIPPFPEREQEPEDESSDRSEETQHVKPKNKKPKKKSSQQIIDSSPQSTPPKDSSPSTPQSPVSQKEYSNQGDVEQTLFKKLCLVNQGVLFENDLIQIGVKSQYQSGFGQIALFFGNKTMSPLENFAYTVSSTPYLLIQADGSHKVIEGGAQQKILIKVQCQTPYPGTYPVMAFSFSFQGKTIQHQLNLPIPASKFVEPLNLGPDQFGSMWSSINDPNACVQDIFKALYPINIEAIEKVLNLGLRLQVLEGVSNNINNIVASGTFTCVQGKAMCTVLLETNPKAQMIRMTLKATTPSVTQSMRHALLYHLSVPTEDTN